MDENLKLKYILGTYKDNINYPTIEDAKFLLDNYFLVNKTNSILHTKIESILKNNIENIINELLESNYIEIDKSTIKKYKKI